MPKAHVVNRKTEFDLSNARCREEVERSFHTMLADLGNRGWHPAEVALALADTVEDYIIEFPVGPSLRN
ncbi:hypothetical protein OIU34_15345 [Pararhizobium sp. BT-229]|uniref:hypothetical protein n=1 Tax=Pararhizobium sp. BT-229 TaxID=2986923 RepID=UPI0021F7BF8A|nr:hypothetical protein [Pararhizobium sp. BT-229]MCV9963283.1 hypothetical protein [Pararhizobium sp. BT-229]